MAEGPLIHRRRKTAVAALLLAAGILAAAAFFNAALGADGKFASNFFPTDDLAKFAGAEFRALPENALAGSADCRPCHQAIFRQWSRSMHAYGARTWPFRTTAAALMKKHGDELGRACAACHAPAAAFEENAATVVDPDHAGTAEGVGCRACHYLRNGGGQNARYEIRFPFVDANFAAMEERSEYILTNLPRHIDDNADAAMLDGSMCYSCHFLESMRNGQVKVPLDNVNSYLKSSFAGKAACQECHMPLLQVDEYGAPTLDHRFFGNQMELAKVAIDPEQEERADLEDFDRQTGLWLAGGFEPAGQLRERRGETPFVGHGNVYRRYKFIKSGDAAAVIDDVISGGPHFDMGLEEAAYDGETLAIKLWTLNRNISHDFPSSLFANITDIWFELSVKDAAGREIYSSGFDADDYEHRLGRVEVDPDGVPIRAEDSLKYVDIINKKYLQPDEKYYETWTVPNVAPGAFPLTANYRLRYRRYTDRFIEWATAGEIASLPERTVMEAKFELAADDVKRGPAKK